MPLDDNSRRIDRRSNRNDSARQRLPRALSRNGRRNPQRSARRLPGISAALSFVAEEASDPAGLKSAEGPQNQLGVGLRDCIRSGVVHTDCEIGVYAGDAESYAVYAPLFDPVIADCHPDFAAAGRQRRSALEAATFHPANPDPDGRYIVSTRVRVVRNLVGYRLRATSTADEDRDIERKAKAAFSDLPGELAGLYRPMADLATSGPARAVDDHIFERGDRFEEAAGFNRRWPIGRGVFSNEARSFFSWVNEEDHLRFISIQRNADIADAFARLCKAMDIVDRRFEFQHADRLGYIASCPSKSGHRASRQLSHETAFVRRKRAIPGDLRASRPRRP